MSPGNNDNKRKIDALVEALDEGPITDEEAREEVARLGIDVKAMAANLRAKVAAADAGEARKKRIDDARRDYAAEIEKLEKRKPEPIRERTAQLAMFKKLLAKAPANAVAMHFHKYEDATDEELAELIRSLRHLLGEDESDSD